MKNILRAFPEVIGEIRIWPGTGAVLALAVFVTAISGPLIGQKTAAYFMAGVAFAAGWLARNPNLEDSDNTRQMIRFVAHIAVGLVGANLFRHWYDRQFPALSVDWRQLAFMGGGLLTGYLVVPGTFKVVGQFLNRPLFHLD